MCDIMRQGNCFAENVYKYKYDNVVSTLKKYFKHDDTKIMLEMMHYMINYNKAQKTRDENIKKKKIYDYNWIIYNSFNKSIENRRIYHRFKNNKSIKTWEYLIQKYGDDYKKMDGIMLITHSNT